MTNDSRSFLFVLLFCCLGNALFSQANDSLFRHRFAWTKDEHALRYEVLIEKMENNEYSLVLQEFTEEHFIYFSLPPGDYRLRIIPYDIFGRSGKGSEWKNLTVLAISGPTPGSQLVIDDVTISEQEEVAMPELVTGQTETDVAVTPPPEKYKDFYFGFFAEGLGYSRYSAAFGGGIVFGGGFNGMGLGISLLYAQDPEKFVFLETLAHFRLYISRVKNNTGLFLQAEGGIVLFANEKFETADNFSPTAGLGAGWRFPLGKLWYIEPVIRGGYPYIYGASLSTGIRFD